MPAAKYDFEIEQGATFRLPMVWRDAEGDPIDLSGYAARMQVRGKIGDDDFLFEATSGPDGGIVIDPVAGSIVVEISAVDTAAIHWRRGVYDLEIEAPDGFVTRLVQGAVSVSPEVTR
jgi:hypothetical protein